MSSSPPSPQGAEALLAEALYARAGEFAPEPRLHATARALELLGDPQKSLTIIHVTGTNGKTSTSRIAESIVRATGVRTGLFTSPDLGHINQRICIDGAPMDARLLLDRWRVVDQAIGQADAELRANGERPLTFFETITVLAFSAFHSQSVEVAVVEVGMGGEWDSTNVADGDVAVFTPIDLDHVERLGRSIAEIATTKSGIIKQGARVVSAEQPAEAEAILAAKSEAQGATLYRQGRDFRVIAREPRPDGQTLAISSLITRYDDVAVSLLGAHQAQNTAVAIAACEALLGPIDDAVLKRGVEAATSPGRLQVLSRDPLVIADAAHNPHGVTALAATLREQFAGSYLIGVAGVLRDKDARGIFRAIDDLFGDLIVTSAPSPRAESPDVLAATARTETNATVSTADSVTAAVDLAKRIAEGYESAAIVVFGSITVTSEALTLPEGVSRRDPAFSAPR